MSATHEVNDVQQVPFESGPRTKGFNYGIGWGSAPKPPIYLSALALARTLTRRAVRMSQEAWVLEMACREVRLASSATEKRIAMDNLTRLICQPSHSTIYPSFLRR